ERRRVDELIQQLGDERFPRREQARAELLTLGPSILGSLRQVEEDRDTELRVRAAGVRARFQKTAQRESPLLAAAARTLARQAVPEAVAVLLAYLPFAPDDAVVEALQTALTTLAVRGGQADPALRAALQSSVPLQRAAAAVALTPHRLAEVD